MNLLTTFYQNLMGVRQKKLDKSESCGTIDEQKPEWLKEYRGMAKLVETQRS